MLAPDHQLGGIPSQSDGHHLGAGSSRSSKTNGARPLNDSTISCALCIEVMHVDITIQSLVELPPSCDVGPLSKARNPQSVA